MARENKRELAQRLYDLIEANRQKVTYRNNTIAIEDPGSGRTSIDIPVTRNVTSSNRR